MAANSGRKTMILSRKCGVSLPKLHKSVIIIMVMEILIDEMIQPFWRCKINDNHWATIVARGEERKRDEEKRWEENEKKC